VQTHRFEVWRDEEEKCCEVVENVEDTWKNLKREIKAAV
ncbi:hypothetical protein A2U01_0106184, partial [Trifolium medium]|nr:hypothetical protein [Trifolium medium]